MTRIEQNQASLPAPAVLSATTGFTRPADANAYTSGDSMNNSTSAPVIMTFTGCARDHRESGLIVSARLVDSAAQATKLIADLFLFSETMTMDNDNAAFTPTDDELLTCVAVIPFSSWSVGDATAGAGGNAISLSGVLNLPFRCATGSTTLYGVLVARNAYTPVSGERFDVFLDIEPD